MQAILENEDVMRDRGKFTEAAVDAVADSFVQAKGKNKGKLSAKDRAGLAKKFSNFHKNLIESVDSEGLWDAILNSDLTLSQANAWGTDKHGGKIMALARKRKEFMEYREQLRHTPEGFAKGIGDARNAGYAGAATRLEGSKKNFDSRIGQSLDGGGNGGLLTALTDAQANFIQAMAELPDKVIATGAGAAYLGGKAATVGGTAVLTGTAVGIGTGVGTGAISASALATTLGVLAMPAALGAIGAAALVVTNSQAQKVVKEEGVKALIGKADGGEAPALNPMEGMAPKEPFIQKWFKTRFPETFGNWGGSLPPGTAGMPQPAPVRLPGLDGRPKADVTPQGDDSALKRLSEGATDLKANLEKASATTVAPQADSSGLDGLLSKIREVIAGLNSIPGAASSSAASANGALAGIRARANPNSFSDGVTAGAGP